jgi:hypothetical protein
MGAYCYTRYEMASKISSMMTLYLYRYLCCWLLNDSSLTWSPWTEPLSVTLSTQRSKSLLGQANSDDLGVRDTNYDDRKYWYLML